MNGQEQAALFIARKRRRRRVTATPVNTVLPVVSGTLQVGEELTCTTGTWTNSPIAYKYEWRRDDAIIAGANQSAYTLVADDEDADINCTVRAVNEKGGATGATSESVGPVFA